MNDIGQTTTRNRVLRALGSERYHALLPSLKTVDMPLGMSICRPLESIEHIYFPETSVISVVTYLRTGDSVENGVIGNDLMSGLDVVLHQDHSPRESMVQLAGIGKKVRVDIIRGLIAKDPFAMKVFLKAVAAFMVQTSQNPACVAYHRVEQRLARWLLTFHDRSDSDVMLLTQEFMSMMIGTRRPIVSRTAAKFQEAGLITYQRGSIRIIDRKGLMRTACECYNEVNTLVALED